MAKPKRKKRKPGSGYTPPPVDVEGTLKEAEEIMSRLEEADEGRLWGELQRQLGKAKADTSKVARAVIGRNLEEIRQIIAVIRNPELAVAEEEPEETLPDVPQETLREAMRAFRKRMKLTKLDHESKLGRSPLTSGKDADFEAILPPHQYKREVWQVLVSRGELEYSGQGFYKLPDERKEF